MGTQKLTIQRKKPLFVSPCECVYICLPAEWAAKTQDGREVIKATVSNSDRPLGGRSRFSRLLGRIDPRDSAIIQYTLLIDDTQLLDDPGTSAPWIVGCSDVLDITAECCMFDKVYDVLAGPPE